MFHQTLIPSSLSLSSSPSASSLSSLLFNPSAASFPLHLGPLQLPSPVPPLVYFNCSQVEREARMEEALKSSLRPESSSCSGQQQQQQNKGAVGEEAGWAAERGNLSGEGFSVDDLLNLGDYAENDKEAEVVVVVGEVGAKAEAAEAEHRGGDDSNTSSPSSSSSALSFPPPHPPPLSEISLPAHDAEELEWVSFIMEDSISEFPQCPGGDHFPSAPPSHGQTETPAAAAQGSSFSSPAVCKLSTEATVPVKAKRSKRSRSVAAWSMSATLPFADSPSSVTAAAATSSSASSSFSSHTNASTSCLIYDRHPVAGGGDKSFLLSDSPPPPARKQGPKKRGRKPKPPAAAAASSGERRCSHCGAQKTPQWRTGPLGAKTLCNACGVRFKSGRLLPEYRPACSPTFVSHIHSNSHRKVLEMRRKKEAELLLSAAAAPVASF